MKHGVDAEHADGAEDEQRRAFDRDVCEHPQPQQRQRRHCNGETVDRVAVAEVVRERERQT